MFKFVWFGDIIKKFVVNCLYMLFLTDTFAFHTILFIGKCLNIFFYFSQFTKFAFYSVQCQDGAIYYLCKHLDVFVMTDWCRYHHHHWRYFDSFSRYWLWFIIIFVGMTDFVKVSSSSSKSAPSCSSFWRLFDGKDFPIVVFVSTKKETSLFKNGECTVSNRLTWFPWTWIVPVVIKNVSLYISE